MTAYGPYPAVVVKIHDGDTFTLAIDLGFDLVFTEACRVYGINAPELSTQAGKQALVFAQTLLHLGDRVSVVSHSWDKYGGRFDGTVTLPDGRNFADEMIKAGQAVKYG